MRSKISNGGSPITNRPDFSIAEHNDDSDGDYKLQ